MLLLEADRWPVVLSEVDADHGGELGTVYDPPMRSHTIVRWTTLAEVVARTARFDAESGDAGPCG